MEAEEGMEECVKVGLSREDAFCHSKQNVVTIQICAWMKLIWPPSLVEDATRF